MAMQVNIPTLGIDIAKDWFDVSDGESVTRIANTDEAIRAFIGGLSRATRIAMEPTNRYHEPLMLAAIAAGHIVYLVDAFRLSRYRDAMGVRAKTDPGDARLLRRYLNAEALSLVPYCPKPKAVQRVQSLLGARATLVQSKTSMGLSLAGVAELAVTRKALLKRIDAALAVIDRKLCSCVEQAGYSDDYKRCLAIPGVGPLNAAALVAVFHRGAFRSIDAFIAYLGLDVRVRDSGKYRGLRKLTKRGNPEIRRLLFNGARAGSATAQWKSYYDGLLNRGFSTTAATVAVARKIAKLAFALLRDQSEYRVPATG